ncbi:MAG: hypothetical protein M3Q98_08675 [Actinomycetota bacterium]|nr:hypothetical protein [Actinomycetota bacterium]
MSQLILIPVPGTTPEGEPVVRVVVVPKLDAAPTAADAGLGDWPATLGDASFQVSINDGPPLDVATAHDADINVWRSFFGSLRVETAAAPEIGDPPEVRATTADVIAVDKTYRAAAGVDVDPDSGDQPNLGTTAAAELRERWSAAEPEVPAAGTAPAAPTADFHLVLGMLREHPAVMRRLGLVFDLPLPAGTALGDSGTVRIRWPNPPPGVPEPVSPRAAYEVDDDRGLVPGRTAIAKAGLLDLGDTDSWMTATLDIDNAVNRLRDAAATVGPAPAQGTETEVDGAVRLPALRSAGILLLRKGREGDFVNRRNAAATNAALPSVEDAEPLNAEDLMLGLRLDVRLKGAPKWTSLVSREAHYTVDGNDILPQAEEEGHVKSGAAVRQGDGILRADEIVARWNGWSLAVPQASPGTRHADRRQDLPFDFGWEFEVPTGSLLPLRFGRDYHLRTRIADLAGGGVGPGDRDMNTGTGPIPYTRHEPIGSPTVTLPDGFSDLGPGGGLDMVVIRSDAADYPRNDERVLSAPMTTLDVAEQHGMLDGSDEATFQRVLRALDGGLPDPASAGVTIFVVPEPGGLSARTHLLAWSGAWPETSDKRLVLVARDDDDDPPIDPDGAKDVVRVQLAPAEQATLALSSFLRDDFLDHLALHQWRSTALPPQMVKDGRHPMATPVHQVTFVHAVRRPLKDPSGTLTPVQEPGAMAAVLTPQPSRLNIDTASTQQLQIAAAWTEVDDDVSTLMTGVAVQNVPVSRGDEALQQQVVQQFGDTRHRMVTYSYAAIGRFRHLFRADEDAERFVARGGAAPISVKSTVRPAPPSVRAVVPAFRWTSETVETVIRHVRSGGTLRVELHRPWHLTGEHEQLAVVVEQTELARDPIWTTPLVDRVPPLAAFIPATGETRKLPDGTPVTVVAYDTEFTEDWWAADVELPGIAAASYRPFVRLAVARYQRESLADLELSDVVLTDLVQLLPERTVTVETGGAALQVKVDGPGPQGPNENRIDVIVETRSAATSIDVSALSPAEGLDAWTAAEIVSGRLGQQIQVSRPATAAGTLRIRVREVELLAPAGAPQAAQTGTAGELSERVVFTDLIPID